MPRPPSRRWPWRRTSEPDPLGTGLWRRAYDDCATAARHAPVLDDLLPQVRAMAETGQAQWPSDTLDVPAAADGRRHYQRLRDVQRCFREVAYRTRVGSVDAETSGPGTSGTFTSGIGTSGAAGRQVALGQAALDEACRLLRPDDQGR